jgi:CRISPR/Cas system-associated exonuclease Cas4 (RecB family)
MEGDESVMEKEPALIPIWRVTEPTDQARAPEWMSFHVFKEAQRCPLSIALQRSSYRQLWSSPGYPTRPTAAAISGIIVHEAAEFLLKQFALAGVTTLMQPQAMKVLKELGGFTKVVEKFLADFLARENENPRFEQFRDDLVRTLRLKLPQMRATLQAILVSHVWAPVNSESANSREMTSKLGRKKPTQRASLGSGTFVEIDLQDALAKWRGRVDILDVDESGCAITDLKSGVASDEHKEQLIVYAMLWNEDLDRNPAHLPIKSLQIVYGSGTIGIEVPNTSQMQKFRKYLIDSSELVRSALNASSVSANPSKENCRHCPVKLLCQPYWQSLPSVSSDDPLSNNQVTLIEARGDRAWLGIVTASAAIEVDQKIIVRNYEGGKAFWNDLRPGLSIRLTDGVLSSLEETSVPVFNLSMMSEALFLS